MNDYDTLGVPRSSTIEAAKDAYRKLRTKYHPDRNPAPDAKIKFQEVQAAWERIEKGVASRGPVNGTSRPRPNANPSMDDLIDELRRSNQYRSASTPVEEVLVSLRDAYRGFTYESEVDGKQGTVTVPGGYPNGAIFDCVFTPAFNTGVAKRKIKLRVENPPGFEVKGFDSADSFFTGTLSSALSVGDVESTIEVDALDLYLGTWITVKDFTGEELQVRIPAGHSINTHLKLKGKGYISWSKEYNRPSGKRADFFVKIKPIFKPMSELELEKVKRLYDEVQAMKNAS